MVEDRVTSWLEEAGYRIEFREHVWHECLIWGEGDRCLGLGASHHDAFLDALSKLLPSRAAQGLLASWLGITIAELGLPTMQAAATLNHQTASQRPATRPTAARPAPRPLALSSDAPQSAMQDDFHADESSAESGRTEFTSAIGEPGAIAAAPDLRRARLERPELERTQTITALSNLRDTVSQNQEELGLSAPERQRLVILGWIARARWLQDMYPADREIEGLARDIAGALGAFCKRWWPGNVRALQRNSHPDDVTRDLLVVGLHAPVPATWKKVSELAQEAQGLMEDRDEQRGLDEYGWADAQNLIPYHRSPDSALEALADEVAAVSGAIGLARPLQVAPDPDRFLGWVRKLRWLRTSVSDAHTWADLAGRLRYLAGTYGSLLSDGSDELQPEFAPSVSWAALLGYDRKHKERSRQIREIFDSLPKASSRTKKEAIVEWLLMALPYADTQHSNIVSAMEPFQEKVLELQPSDLPEADRRLRRRLHKLQQTLRGDEPSLVRDIEPLEGEEPGEELTIATSELPADQLARALQLTRGKRATFVSNRSDPDLMKSIKSAFEFSDLKWCEGEPRRIDAVCEAITAGKFDIVLCATGFQSHAVDGKLARACRDASIPYARVNRGRPLACLRALLRLASRTGANQEPVLS